MSVLPRLAGFGAVLAIVFATALVVGDRAGIDRGAAARADGAVPAMTAMAGGHGEDGAPAPQTVRGLAVSEGGLTLALARTTAPAGEPFALAFRVVDRRGQTVRTFDVEHTKRMHVVLVRRDMTGFQHLHPTQRPDGTWTVPATVRDPGAYRVFADFAVRGRAHTLAGDISVDGAVRSRALPAPAGAMTVDGLRVRLDGGTERAGAEAELRFSVTRAGRPVAVEPYLGARGHLVALRAGDLAFLHVHPDARRLRFMATLPTAGSYRLFLQFKTEGRVHTAAFTREVAR